MNERYKDVLKSNFKDQRKKFEWRWECMEG